MNSLPTPRVFVSSTSSDLGSARKVINDALIRIGCLPVEESVFPTEYGVVLEMLKRKMSTCDAAIHIVGRDYGGEPNPHTLPAGQLRRSWAQIEYDIAVDRNMPLYLFVCSESYPFDDKESHTNSSEEHDCILLQAAHRERVLGDSRLQHIVNDSTELRDCIAHLQERVEAIASELKKTQSQFLRFCVFVLATLLLVFPFLQQIIKSVTSVQKSVDTVPERTSELILRDLADPHEISARLRTHIEKRFQEDLDGARKHNADWKEIRELERRRDVALLQVDELLRTVKNGLADQPEPVFLEATRILFDESLEASVAYLNSHRTQIMTRVDELNSREFSIASEKRKVLETVLLEARLRAANLQKDESLELFQYVADQAPQWSKARWKLGLVLNAFARYAEAAPHLVAAVNCAETELERAESLNALSCLYLEQAEWEKAESVLRKALGFSESSSGPITSNTATILSNLAKSLNAQNKWHSAELLARRALEIDESLKERTEDYATHLSSLASALHATNRLKMAEALYRNSLAVSESQSTPSDPSNCAHIHNMAVILQVTSRLSVALPLYLRALQLEQQFFGPDHPAVADSLNNLATLLQLMNHHKEAEMLLRRALTIDELAFGISHSGVATRLNNLAAILDTTNRQPDSEQLVRVALEIHENSYAPDHTEVAADLGLLGKVVLSMGLISEAEIFQKRAIKIYLKRGLDSHPEFAVQLINLAVLIRQTNQSVDAVPLYRNAVLIDENSYGASHPRVGIDLHNLGVLFTFQGDYTNSELLLRRALCIYNKSYGLSHSESASTLSGLANVLISTERPFAAEPLIRNALSYDESKYGPMNDRVALRLYTLANLLRTTDRAELAGPVLHRAVKILSQFRYPTGIVHPNLMPVSNVYQELLISMGMAESQAHSTVATAMTQVKSLPPITPEIGRLLGPGGNVEDVLLELDRQYKNENKSRIWFLTLDEPISPHLDELLGPLIPVGEILEILDGKAVSEELSAIVDLPVELPISSALNEVLEPLSFSTKGGRSLTAFVTDLLGPEEPVEETISTLSVFQKSKADPVLCNLSLKNSLSSALNEVLGTPTPTEDVLKELDQEYRRDGKSAVWFLSIDQPISSYLDELLGPIRPVDENGVAF
jgi:tetratricopeptide (TPR) repeat protein